jgi:hypothetical protein
MSKYGNGTPVSWSRDLYRITITLPEAVIAQLKITAVKENRTLSAEVKTRIERTLQADGGVA